MKITPLHRQVLIAPILDGAVSKAGLLLPDIARNRSPFRYGDVVAVGTGSTNAAGVNVPCVVHEGDVVMFARNAGLEIPIETEKGEEVMVVMDEKFILGIVAGLARETSITGIDGRLLSMMPGSSARSDGAYENIEKTEIARREGWLDVNADGTDDHVDEVETA